MQNNGYEELLLAKSNGKIEGTILTLFFNGNSIQHALSNSPHKDLVGTFLTWNTIKWAYRKNIHLVIASNYTVSMVRYRDVYFV